MRQPYTEALNLRFLQIHMHYLLSLKQLKIKKIYRSELVSQRKNNLDCVTYVFRTPDWYIIIIYIQHTYKTIYRPLNLFRRPLIRKMFRITPPKNPTFVYFNTYKICKVLLKVIVNVTRTNKIWIISLLDFKTIIARSNNVINADW